MLRFSDSGKYTKTKRRLCALLALALLIPTSTAIVPNRAEAAEVPAVTVTFQGNDIVTAGAIVKNYDAAIKRGTSTVHTKVRVLEVNLKMPYVKIDVMSGDKNSFATYDSVRSMVTDTGAVAGINGDVYNTKSQATPMGPVIKDGELISTPMYVQGLYTFALTKDNKPVIDMFSYQGSVTAMDGARFTIAGINKSYYYMEPTWAHSMVNAMYLYTDEWASTNRGNDGNTVPTEVLVQDGVVTQVSIDKPLAMVVPKGASILRASGTAAEYVKDHIKVGEPITIASKLVSKDPTKTYTDQDFRMMIGTHTILVDNGQPAAFSRDVSGVSGNYPAARTAIGYSQDQSYVYMVTADKAGSSAGMTLAEMQQFLIKIGAYKAANLDGGGSTQMVARPLGTTDIKIINSTTNGDERRVVNGLGVYTSAPQGAALKVEIVGQDVVLMGERVPYQIKGYDTYYNPLPLGTAKATWSSSTAIGTFDSNVFTVKSKGSTTITAVSGQAKASKTIRVAGKDDIASMQILPSSTVIMDGTDIRLSAKIKLKNGSERIVSGSALKWELMDFEGQVTGDVLHVTKAGTQGGKLVGRYDGFSAIVSMGTGTEKLFTDFGQTDVPAAVAVTPPGEVIANVTKVPGLFGLSADNTALKLEYDMTPGTYMEKTKVAYARFGTGGTGISVTGQPKSVSLKVYGDNSLNMLRMEVVDGKGLTNWVTLEDRINWTGWKTVSASLSQLTYPIKLKSVYVANPAQGQDERLGVGAIGVDDIELQYQSAAPALPRNQIKLTIGSTNVLVNGKVTSISPWPAPYILNGRTMVPIKFVTEALGGTVKWDGTQYRVSVYRGGQLAEMWINNKNMVINGQAVTSDVPPILKNNYTVVPIALLSEKFGWKVTWDEATRTVTME